MHLCHGHFFLQLCTLSITPASRYPTSLAYTPSHNGGSPTPILVAYGVFSFPSDNTQDFTLRFRGFSKDAQCHLAIAPPLPTTPGPTLHLPLLQVHLVMTLNHLDSSFLVDFLKHRS